MTDKMIVDMIQRTRNTIIYIDRRLAVYKDKIDYINRWNPDNIIDRMIYEHTAMELKNVRELLTGVREDQIDGFAHAPDELFIERYE